MMPFSGIFGIGFRLLLVALAVIVERVGTFLRDNAWIQTLLRTATASPPEDLEAYLRREAEESS